MPKPATFWQREFAFPFWLRVLLGLVLFCPALLGLVVGIRWWLVYAGFYRWLVEVQINLLGHYYLVFSGLFTLAFCLLLGAILGRLLAELIIFLLGKAEVFPAASERSPPVSRDADRWIREHGGRLCGLGFGLGMVIIGAVWTMSGSTAGSLQALDVAALETGQPPPSNYLQITGRPLTDQMLVQREGAHDRYFLPFVSDRWQKGSQVTLYVAMPAAPRGGSARVTLKGVLAPNGLPGPVRTAFEKSQAARPAQPHYLLKVGLELFFGGMGTVILGATGVFWVVKALRQGKYQTVQLPDRRKRAHGKTKDRADRE